VRGEGAAAALWVDPAVHAEECRRFDSFVVRGPGFDDCDFFVGAIGTDGYGRFFIYRGGSGICVRPHRYALARALGSPLASDEFGLQECDMPLCVKMCGADAPRRLRELIAIGTRLCTMKYRIMLPHNITRNG
jgi:hypothetical protein